MNEIDPFKPREKKNNSAAVVAKRKASRKTLDYFPTPAWATRALIEKVLRGRLDPPRHDPRLTCLEPACGGGHMAEVLRDYFSEVRACDVHDYGYAHMDETADFLFPVPVDPAPDWIITNPPFVLAEDFIFRAWDVAAHGVAMLCRLSFAETHGRYKNLFSINPPQIIAQFVERVGMMEGKVHPKAEGQCAFAWFIWDTYNPKRPLGKAVDGTQFVWIPPCRKELERDGDYSQPERITE